MRVKSEGKFWNVLFCSLFLTIGANQAFAVNIATDTPKTGIDPAGVTIAVWGAIDNAFIRKIQTSTFDPVTSTWSTPPTDLIASATQDAYSPKIKVNATGDAVAVWLGSDYVAGNGIIQADMYIGGSWTLTPVVISDLTGEYVVGDFDISFNDAGLAVATWNSYVGLSGSPVVRSSSATITGGNVWSLPMTISN